MEESFMYSQSGMYGINPCYTLAETPYARMTGMFTPINYQIPNTASYLQPMFVDMNQYTGNTGIPSYPSFIGGMAMMNPQIPIVQPNQINQWQQQYQNYPQQSYQQPMQNMYYPQQQQQYQNYPQQSYYQQPTQNMYYPQQQQQMYYPQQSALSAMTNIINNYFMGNQQSANYQQPAQTMPIQNPIMNMFQTMLSSLSNMMNTSSFLGNNTQNNVTNIFNIILNPNAAVEPTPLYDIFDWLNIDIDSNSQGDPHFGLVNEEGKRTQAFDFQGRNDTAYNMIENDDFTLNADFNDAKDLGARIITDQNLTLKGTDVNIVSHQNGKFDIYHDGEKIGDQSNYQELADDARLEGIDISYDADNSNLLTVKHNDREIKQNLLGDVRNATNVTSEDTGMLTQMIGALDDDGNLLDSTAEVDLNKDGEISDNEKLNYNSGEQALVNTKTSAIAAPVKVGEGEDSHDLAVSFLNSAASRTNYVDEVFDGAFEGSGEITSATDERLTIKDTDSEGVKLAKQAMKEALEADKSEEAIDSVAAWIDWSTSEVEKDGDVSKDKGSSIAAGFEENDGYSKSQWNEFWGSQLFAVEDSIFTK